MRHSRAAAVTAIVALACVLANRSVAVGALGLRDGEEKYPKVGEYVRDRLPASAFVIAMQHSGSIRYYSGRPTLRWDVLDRASLAQAVSQLKASGYTPFAVLDPDEDVAFRERFGNASAAVVADMVGIGHVGATQIYTFR